MHTLKALHFHVDFRLFNQRFRVSHVRRQTCINGKLVIARISVRNRKKYVEAAISSQIIHLSTIDCFKSNCKMIK